MFCFKKEDSCLYEEIFMCIRIISRSSPRIHNAGFYFIAFDVITVALNNCPHFIEHTNVLLKIGNQFVCWENKYQHTPLHCSCHSFATTHCHLLARDLPSETVMQSMSQVLSSNRGGGWKREWVTIWEECLSSHQTVLVSDS